MKYLLIILLFLTSCSLERRLEKYCPLCVQETKTETVIEYRDTTIEIPGETVTIVDSLYCDSLGNIISRLGDFIVQKDGTILRLERKLKDNVYTTKATADTVYIKVEGNTVYKKEIVYKKGEKYIPSTIIFLAYSGGILLSLLLIYVVYRIIKKRLL
jgi:hypothetical protein